MENGRRMRGVAMAVTLTLGGAAATASAQTPAGPSGDAQFSAEVSVQRAVVDARGLVTRELPGAKYLLERRADGRVRLTMRPTRTSPASGPLADPYAGMVVDQDESGALRVIGKDGKPVAGVPPPAGGVSMGAAEGDALVLAGDLQRRRERIVDAFGQRVGAVRGLDRHVVQTGETVQEVLVAPALGLPVEVNVVTRGALSSHHEFHYDPLQDGRMVRSRSRSEIAAGPMHERLVTVTTLSDVRVAGGMR